MKRDLRIFELLSLEGVDFNEFRCIIYENKKPRSVIMNDLPLSKDILQRTMEETGVTETFKVGARVDNMRRLYKKGLVSEMLDYKDRRILESIPRIN